MPRLSHVQPNDVPQHIVQRGNNREACFFAEAGSDAYQALLNEAVSELCVEAIRAALDTGQTLGSEKFKDQIEAVHRGRVRHLSAGRKPKRKIHVEGEQAALDL